MTGISVIDPGTGYTIIPNAYLYGSGSGAQLKANVTNRNLESIDVENPGRGYDSNTMVIVAPRQFKLLELPPPTQSLRMARLGKPFIAITGLYEQ